MKSDECMINREQHLIRTYHLWSLFVGNVHEATGAIIFFQAQAPVVSNQQKVIGYSVKQHLVLLIRCKTT